jgi:hypothetical protein
MLIAWFACEEGRRIFIWKRLFRLSDLFVSNTNEINEVLMKEKLLYLLLPTYFSNEAALQLTSD